MPVPMGDESPAPAITEEVSLQPAGQTVFAGGPDKAIGDQDERPIGERHILSLTKLRGSESEPLPFEEC